MELHCYVDTNYVADVKLDSTIVHLDRIPLLWGSGLFISEES